MTKKSAARLKKDRQQSTENQAPTETVQLQPEPMDDARQYVLSLLKNEIEPPNKFVRDLVEQMRRAEQSLSQIVPRIEQLQQTLNEAQTRRTALVAISQQLGMTIYRWRDGETADKE